MSEKQKYTPEKTQSKNKQPNYRMRQAVAGLAVLGAVAGGAEAINHLKERHLNVEQQGETDEQPVHVHVVKEGENPTSIARQYAEETEDIQRIRDHIKENDDDGILLPTHPVQIPESMISEESEQK